MKLEEINALPPERFAVEVKRLLRKELLRLLNRRRFRPAIEITGLNYHTVYDFTQGASSGARWETIVRALGPVGYKVQLVRQEHFMKWRPLEDDRA